LLNQLTKLNDSKGKNHNAPANNNAQNAGGSGDSLDEERSKLADGATLSKLFCEIVIHG